MEDIRLIESLHEEAKPAESNTPSEALKQVDEFFSELRNSDSFKQVLGKANQSVKQGEKLKDAIRRELTAKQKLSAEDIKSFASADILETLSAIMQELGVRKDKDQELKFDPNMYTIFNSAYNALKAHGSMPPKFAPKDEDEDEDEVMPKKKSQMAKEFMKAMEKNEQLCKKIEQLSSRIEELENKGIKKTREELSSPSAVKYTYKANKDGSLTEV